MLENINLYPEEEQTVIAGPNALLCQLFAKLPMGLQACKYPDKIIIPFHYGTVGGETRNVLGELMATVIKQRLSALPERGDINSVGVCLLLFVETTVPRDRPSI